MRKTALGLVISLMLLFGRVQFLIAGDRAQEKVIVISVDGLSPKGLFDLWARKKHSPLHDLVNKGAYTWQAQTCSLSSTLPCHASMLSGLTVTRHHVDWNSLLPERGSIDVPTVFSLARAAGLETVAIAQKEKFVHLVHQTGPERDIAFFEIQLDRQRVIGDAILCLGMVRPDFMFIHFKDVDQTGHSDGWYSDRQLAALSAIDDEIGRLISELKKRKFWNSGVLIVTSDHGGHGKDHVGQMPIDMTIPWIAYGHGIRHQQLTCPVTTYDTAATAMYLLGLSPPENLEDHLFDGRVVTEIFQH